MRILLDTNIVIYFIKGDEGVRNLIDSKSLVISEITEMELLSYPKIAKEAADIIHDFISQMEILSIDERVKRKAIEIRRENKLRLLDAVILSTSIIHKVPLVTADSDFKRIGFTDIYFYEKKK